MKTNSKNSTFSDLKPIVSTLLFLIILLSGFILIAQPSGGPYGPLHKTYELPKVSGKVYYVSPDGISNATGTDISKPTTL